MKDELEVVKNEISFETKIRAEFFDVDSMNVVYHGNYVKFLEVARCNLLDKIGYGYNEMLATHFMFPITTLNVKYIRSLQFEEEAIVKTTLVEWENRIRIKYEIRSLKTGLVVTKAETTQMAVKMPEGETLFVCPKVFTEKVEAILRAADSSEK